MGAALLAAIPAVGFALWVSYLDSDLERLDSDAELRAAFDPSLESRRVRFAGLVALFTQVAAFFASRSLVPDGVVTSAVLFMVGVLIQSQIQVRAEIRVARLARKLAVRAPKPEPGKQEPAVPPAEAKTQFRSFAALFASIMGFVTVIHFSGALAVLAARWAGASDEAAGAAASIGLLAGILAAVALFFALSPILLRNILPCAPLTGEAPSRLVRECFERAGAREPDVRILELDHFGPNDTLIVGLTGGPAWARPCLFLARGALVFPEEELRALVSREAGQVAVGNLGKRFRYATGLILACIPIMLAYFGLLLLAFPPEAARVGVFAAPLIPLFFFLHFGRRGSRGLEQIADAHAVRELGVPAQALESALLRIERARRESMGETGGEEDEQLARRLRRIRELGSGSDRAEPTDRAA